MFATKKLMEETKLSDNYYCHVLSIEDVPFVPLPGEEPSPQVIKKISFKVTSNLVVGTFLSRRYTSVTIRPGDDWPAHEPQDSHVFADIVPLSGRPLSNNSETRPLENNHDKVFSSWHGKGYRIVTIKCFSCVESMPEVECDCGWMVSQGKPCRHIIATMHQSAMSYPESAKIRDNFMAYVHPIWTKEFMESALQDLSVTSTHRTTHDLHEVMTKVSQIPHQAWNDELLEELESARKKDLMRRFGTVVDNICQGPLEQAQNNYSSLTFLLNQISLTPTILPNLILSIQAQNLVQASPSSTNNISSIQNPIILNTTVTRG